MKKLLIIETDGISEIKNECELLGWHPIFVKTHNYTDWLPLENLNEEFDIRSVNNLSYFEIIKIALEENVSGILPISLLEPEGVRDSLVKDYIINHKILVNIVANSPATMESTFDKWLTKFILSHFNIPVTPGKSINNLEDINDIVKEYSFPIIIKERKSYTGMGVRIINTEEELVKYVTKNIKKGLFAEPFLSGSEISVEVIAWNDEMFFQPLVYKGETRLNIIEHPAYRPRISPYKSGSAIESKIINIVYEVVMQLQLKGAAEFEFLIINGEPLIMEINPRISGVTRLCNAAGGVDVYKELTHICINNAIRKDLVIKEHKYAIQFPLNILPEGDLLEELQKNPHISYIKPITWMPILPIRSSIIMSHNTSDELLQGIKALENFTDPRYITEALKSFDYF
ncbi:ATP-grasp domain-containing protein [Chryseobacterium sp. T1]